MIGKLLLLTIRLVSMDGESVQDAYLPWWGDDFIALALLEITISLYVFLATVVQFAVMFYSNYLLFAL